MAGTASESSERDTLVVRLLKAPLSERAWRATIYATLSAPIGLASSVTLWVLLAVGFGLVFVLLTGLFLVLAALIAAHWLAQLEGWRAAVILGRRLDVRRYPDKLSTWRGLWRRLRRGGNWMELLYGLLVLPIFGWIGYAVVVGAWAAALLLVTFPLYGWTGVAQGPVLAWGLPYLPSAAIHLVAGLYVALLAPWIAVGVAEAELAVARLMLAASREEELSARVETLTETRAGLVDAVDIERRRIERDLHDGAQQRLVAVAMTLGRASQQFEVDPEHARRLVEEAHGETKAALVDLRNLARGIHPAVLTDRGLDAALSALAERSPVPVEVSVWVDTRPSPTVEAVAYFVVSEALANIAKHAQARRARVTATRLADTLIVEIGDDGIGGAHLEPGSGLAGLRERARSVDGTFTLTSPAGGPTLLRVELPCGS